MATKSDPPPPNRDFLLHLEAYLAKRDGVDKLLKISRYAAKIILAADALPPTHPLHPRLKSFESSVGLSRKAFRLGKFIQDLNALRSTTPNASSSTTDLILALVAYGGEGIYYFVEQFVWLSKSGLIDPKRSKKFQTISAWAEFVGYVGSISMKVREIKRLSEEEACLASSLEVGRARGDELGQVEMKLRKVREKKVMKVLSTVQDVADWMMALADIRDGKGRLSQPGVVAWAGMVSALISTHKNWISC